METVVVDLLAHKHPKRAFDFVLAWSDHRNASWLDAAREAQKRRSSAAHLVQLRGQLRYHYGEQALARAAADADVGCMSVNTVQPGSSFMLGTVGRMALVSVTVRSNRSLARRSATRRLLSERNADLDPQTMLPFSGSATPFGARAEFAYFACMVAVPSRIDPSVPGELVLAVPNSGMTDWLTWLPLHRLSALLQERVSAGRAQTIGPEPAAIPDLAFPKFRLPTRPAENSEDDRSA